MEVFERVYGHYHPDYQSNAVNAFNKSRQKPDRLKGIKREHGAPDVVNLDGSH
jgi:hypothetical protein